MISKAPTEPGEYHVRATLLGQPISESILIIEKITPSFKIETAEYEYTPRNYTKSHFNFA